MSLVQYYLVDHSLRMRRGKTCAQCGHGALYAHKLASSMVQHGQVAKIANLEYWRMYFMWEVEDMPKIVLKCDGEHLRRALDEFELAIEVVDSGKTEIAPGTRTVVVLPVMEKESAPQWIRSLPLL